VEARGLVACDVFPWVADKPTPAEAARQHPRHAETARPTKGHFRLPNRSHHAAGWWQPCVTGIGRPAQPGGTIARAER
jgi:hypothetical protein